jgi:hypothetical protein
MHKTVMGHAKCSTDTSSVSHPLKDNNMDMQHARFSGTSADSTLSLTAAPLLCLEQNWQSSLFGRSIQQGQHELASIADEAGMAIGVTDSCGTLLWAWSSKVMRSSAEQVHFVEGGQWSTQSVAPMRLA